ncbi:AI-2E family transporter [Parachitinimonas caeni]|uniref:AI-2E family transporter n=1 Tax=Parachitinimonas caeni TaxID=3031301 RepID=A0ABT7DST0_9NEIS|nr:AI-2E family transporter [Parachitinimonas caeni]MDK2123126.1 AI-2E family transporter [Parachitinimonas caeni]
MRQKRFAGGRVVALLGILAVVIATVYLLAPILAPFVAAAIIAYMLHPLVDRLSRYRLPRSLSAGLVMTGLFVAGLSMLLVIVPLFVQQIRALAGYLPKVISWGKDTLAPGLVQRFGIDIRLEPEQVKAWLASHSDAAGAALNKILPSLADGGAALFGVLANMLLLPVVLFYFLRDWPAVIRMVDELIPRSWHGKVHQVGGEIDSLLGQFLRGQFSVMLIMAAFYSIGLAFTGLHSALAIGLVAGFLVFVPYLGVIVGAGLATLTAALQFGTVIGLLPVWGVFLIGQLLEGFYITPTLVGERIGLHPVAVIFALLAFGQLFGFVGVLLALPLAASLLVALRHMKAHYVESPLYRR